MVIIYSLKRNQSKLFIFGLFVFLSSQIYAQLDPIFEEESGNLTTPFQPMKKMAKILYDESYKDLNRTEGSDILKLLQNGSVFTRMLHKSGTINFNSQATQYLTDLKDYLLKDYPKVAEHIKIYMTFNPALNAFATINKNIYFNVGLLARVKNEAQLAFIMCHEIMHIIENHSVEQYRKMKKHVESVGSSDVARKANQLELVKHTMSQKHEFEADKYGLHLFLTAGYDARYAYEALELLKNADDELEQKKISKDNMRLSEEKFEALLEAIRNKELGKDVLLDNDKDEKKKAEIDDEVESMSTHPDIEDRLIEIEKIIKENEKKHQGKAEAIVNDRTFKRLKEASINMVNSSQNQSSDFVSAFLISANRILEGKSTSLTDYENLAYSVFGIIHDRKYKLRYTFHPYLSHDDSVFFLHYRQNDVKDLTLWGLEVLESHRNPNNSALIDDYMARIINMVGTNKKTLEALESYTARLPYNEFKNSSLNFSDIDFRFSVATKLSNREKREFNKNDKTKEKKTGKVVFLDMNNIVVDVNRFGADLNPGQSDKLDELNIEVFNMLREKSQEELMLMIPNASNYSGKQYMNYCMLLNWINERIYFDQAPYKSLYDDRIKVFCKENDVRYLMLGVNFGLRRKNAARISIPRLTGVVLNPLYLPLAFASRKIEQLRNYQLTVVFDLESSDLVFWDKRSSVEPINGAFMYSTYEDILASFRK